MDVNCEQRETGEPDGAGGRRAPRGGPRRRRLLRAAPGEAVLTLTPLTRKQPLRPPPPHPPRSKRMFFMEGFVAGEVPSEKDFKQQLRELKSELQEDKTGPVAVCLRLVRARPARRRAGLHRRRASVLSARLIRLAAPSRAPSHPAEEHGVTLQLTPVREEDEQ